MINEKDYLGWQSLELAADQASLMIPLEIGPRIVSCALPGGDNLFHLVEAQRGGSGEPDWLLRGGHRLWHAPEDAIRTYQPDNAPVDVVRAADGKKIELSAPVEPRTGLRKSMTVEVIGPESFRITHRLANEGLWTVECAPWALTVMERGGYGIVPLLPKGKHPDDLLPTYSLVPWSYTDLSQPCWALRPDCIGIDTARNNVPQKLGLTNYPGWSAYWQKSGTFVKHASVIPGATYPDFGCAFETFCCDFMIEFETLAPLRPIVPGETVTHVEHWGVLADLPRPDNEESYRGPFLDAVNRWLKTLPL